MSNSWNEPAETVLLTGAGFTKNFGGYLAREMWSTIFNQPELQQYPNLTNCASQEFDFETMYDEVMKSANYSPKEKECLTRCIATAYRQMHENICQHNPQSLAASSGVCSSILAYFAGRRSDQRCGFFFTLNQDLFVERFYSNSDTEKLIDIPGLPQRSPKWFNGMLGTQLKSEDWVKLPDLRWVEKYNENFWSKGSYLPLAYIKLHGSYSWKFHDGRPGIVIGHAKTDLLTKEPLLRWYQSLFKQVLCEGDRKLVVIGYGFNDPHINDVIADAIKYKRLKLHIISPKPPSEFQEDLYPISGFNKFPKPRGQEFWPVGGYHEGKITDFYVTNSQILPPKGKTLMHNLGLI